MKNNTRKQFITTLIELAEKDSNIILLTGDLGFSYLERFRDKFPNQFINTGLIEQTALGICAGLALSGKKPYFYSIIPFCTMRPYEQIRNDISHHNANVKIIGVGGKDFYERLGFTHNISYDEDKKIIETLGNIEIYITKTAFEVREAMLKSYKSQQPAYIRLDRI